MLIESKEKEYILKKIYEIEISLIRIDIERDQIEMKIITLKNRIKQLEDNNVNISG